MSISKFSAHSYAWINVPPEITSHFTQQIDPETKTRFMQQAILEAHKTSLRPTVGAVIVKDKEIIGRGHRQVKKLHQQPPLWRIIHAEQAALDSLAQYPAGATIYVTLEPCAERCHGPTIEAAENCSTLIATCGVSTVVIGLVDQDQMTFGKGLKRLIDAGIQLEYTYHGLEAELLELIGNGQFGTLKHTVSGLAHKFLRN